MLIFFSFLVCVLNIDLNLLQTGLYIQSEDVIALDESLHKLKHLRYLALINTNICVLPGNIG